MITEQSIIDFLANEDYDIRKSHNGRWIDQKCTPDVVSFIADCICFYVSENSNKEFNSHDIWFSEYAVHNTEAVFKKPSPKTKSAQHEYDKFFQQPMKLLANAKVLFEHKIGNRNYFSVRNFEILEYIALSERNALKFLYRYIEKVLQDSDLYNEFDIFFQTQFSALRTKDKNMIAYKKLKKTFYEFTHNYTKIQKDLECGRIFTKVINPLAYFYNACGTQQGHVSKDIITFDMLMYNRNNFRDIYAKKPKKLTRKEYAVKHPVKINEKYYEYQSTRAKRFLKIFNDQYRQGITEHLEPEQMNDPAIHMHHIFPKSVYPEICTYIENLIALTPTQHFTYAHPNGNTQEINIEYQELLLLSKADRIKENLEDSNNGKVDRIYDFSRFLYVLSIGFDNEEVERITNMDFVSVMHAINVHYANII